MTAVLDPNIWISLAWNHNFSVLSEVSERGFTIASSEELLQEFEEVLQRKKFAQKIPPSVMAKILELHRILTFFVAPTYTFAAAPDPNDNYLFDICRESHADFLVTGDKALLEMKTVIFPETDTSIITFAQFREMLTTP